MGKNITITICSSAAFYEQAVNTQEQLQKHGYEVTLPETAIKMQATGDYNVANYKTWFSNADDYSKKAELMRNHFAEIEKNDSILVLNYEKHGLPNYIGGNVLMEMSLAFWLNKPIFILNDIPEESSFEEEIRGMQPILLHGNLADIHQHLKR